MESTPLISVIVPVYRVEAYLDRCVQSIMNQTYENLEIILVDDGSPDNCPAMCDVWAQKDARIKVIHKENGGGAQARNVGLDAASGMYIGFVDSDDFIFPEMYEKLYRLLSVSGSDIAECGFFSVCTDEFPSKTVNQQRVQYFDGEQALFENIRDKVCRQIIWNKIYSKSVLEDIRFVEGKFIDDEFFTYRVLGKAKKIAVSDEGLYCYRQQANSAMHQTYSIKRLDALEARQKRMEYLEDKYPNLVVDAQINLVFSCMYAMQMCLKYLNQEELMIAYGRIQKILNDFLRTILLKKMTLKTKVWICLVKISLINTCKLRNALRIGV